MVRFLATCADRDGVRSLLDWDEEVWRQRCSQDLGDSLSRALVGFACQRITDLADAGG